MIVSDVTTRVLRQFGDEASVQIDESDIMRWINDAAKDIAVQNDNNQATATQASVIGTNTYVLPADMLTIRSVYFDSQKLDFYTRAEYDAYINSVDPTELASGTPTIYTRNFTGTVSNLLVYPTPSVVKNIKIWYYRRPFEVAVSTDPLPFSEEYHLRIVEYCLQQAYQTDEDWEAAERMKGQLDDGLTKLKQLESSDDSEFYGVITVLPEDGGYYY